MLGTPVDADGYELEPNAHPNPPLPPDPADYSPFESQADFEFTEWIYSKSQVSANRIDELLHILAKLYPDRLTHILKSLRPHMTTPKVMLCGDGHYCRVIYGLGPYIADYPKQALLACIVQGWCPK